MIMLLSISLILMGLFCHYLLNKIQELREQVEDLGSMIVSMALELSALGSPNVFIAENPQESPPK